LARAAGLGISRPAASFPALPAASAEKYQGGEWGGRTCRRSSLDLAACLAMNSNLSGDEDGTRRSRPPGTPARERLRRGAMGRVGLADRRYGNFLHNKNRASTSVLQGRQAAQASPHNDAKSSFRSRRYPKRILTHRGRRAAFDRRQLATAWVSVRLTSNSCTTSSPTTKLLTTPCRSSSRSRLRAPFGLVGIGRRDLKGWGGGVNTPEPILRVLPGGRSGTCVCSPRNIR